MYVESLGNPVNMPNSVGYFNIFRAIKLGRDG